MTEQQEKDAPRLDADGLEIREYEKTMLVVVPPSDYSEQCLRHVRSALLMVGVATRSVSSESEEPVHGRLQDEFLVDGPPDSEKVADYVGVVFIDGDPEASLAGDPQALRLAREAAAAGLVLAALGNSVEVLAAADVVRGKRIAAPPALADAVRQAGGRFSTRQVEVSDTVVTAVDDAAGLRFGRALAEVVTA